MFVTQWFSGWELPQRVGVYQRLYPIVGVYQRLYPIYRTDVIEYCFWDGKKWYADKYPDAKWVSCYQNLKWRGIAEGQ